MRYVTVCQVGWCSLTNRREIRLYPNRRLYDPVASRSVTFDDVCALVQLGVPVVITDTERGEDRTRRVLAAILVGKEMESQGEIEPVLTAEFLIELIRLSEREKPSLVAAFLSHSMDMLTAEAVSAHEPF